MKYFSAIKLCQYLERLRVSSFIHVIGKDLFEKMIQENEQFKIKDDIAKCYSFTFFCSRLIPIDHLIVFSNNHPLDAKSISFEKHLLLEEEQNKVGKDVPLLIQWESFGQRNITLFNPITGELEKFNPSDLHLK